MADLGDEDCVHIPFNMFDKSYDQWLNFIGGEDYGHIDELNRGLLRTYYVVWREDSEWVA